MKVPGARRVKVRVPATTANLGAGCDCLGLALSLYNTVAVGLAGSRLAITVSGEGEDAIPRNRSNLVWQAMERLWAEAGFPVPAGVRIALKNQIPPGAGLGSSAAAIIGGLLAADALAGGVMAREEILTLATAIEGHPDNVAPALLGGAVVAVAGEGGQVVGLKFSVAPELRAVVAVPDYRVATTRAREILPPAYPREDALYNVGRVALLVGALASGRYDLLRFGMQDRLYQPYRAPLVAGLKEALAAAIGAGAAGAALSGAGPAVVALTTQKTKRIGTAMLGAFSAAGVKARILTLVPDNDGALVEEFPE